MALDILKEYLVKVGFKVDEQSFKRTEKVIDKVGIQAGKSLKTVPIEKVFGKKTADAIKQIGKNLSGFTDVIKTASEVMGKSAGSAEGTEAATAAFGITALGTTAVIAAFMVALGGIVAGINAYIQNVAQADLKTEFFARRMLMTKQNALSLQETMKVVCLQEMVAVKSVESGLKLASKNRRI